MTFEIENSVNLSGTDDATLGIAPASKALTPFLSGNGSLVELAGFVDLQASLFFTPEGLHSTAQGKRSATLGREANGKRTLKGFHNCLIDRGVEDCGRGARQAKEPPGGSLAGSRGFGD